MGAQKGPPRRAGQARIRARRRPARVDVQRDTALPSDLFGCPEPLVEAALIDAAARVFLDQLGPPPGGEPDAGAEPPLIGAVDAEAIAACLREFRDLTTDAPAAEAPPDLMRGLADERVWILLDLARNGTGLGRQRATLELRQRLHELADRPQDHHALLLDLAQQLERAVHSGTFPVVFTALLLETRAGLRRLDAPLPAQQSRS